MFEIVGVYLWLDRILVMLVDNCFEYYFFDNIFNWDIVEKREDYYRIKYWGMVIIEEMSL